MPLYRQVWTATWLVVSAVPVFFGLLVAPPVAMFCAAAVTVTCAAALGRGLAGCMSAGLLTAAGIAALWWVGPCTLAVVALVVASSPDTLERASRVFGPEDARDTDVSTVDDARLCAAWSESYVALRRAETFAERLAIVNARQAYLDELEVRDADGFRTWLSSGARPVGNPAAFLRHR